MTLNIVISEVFYSFIGAVFILVALKALRDESLKNKRFTTALFWFILAFAFIAGPYIPRWITGAGIAAAAVLTGTKSVMTSRSDTPDPADTRQKADLFGYKIFIPALCLAVIAMLAAMFLPFGANNAIGISAAAALAAAYALTKAPLKLAADEGSRMMDSVGTSGILPLILAALGSLFTAAGTGDVIAGGAASLIPENSRLAACAVYCIGMALFTFIMGNGFAAFSVITIGVGMPFLIAKGADPAVVGSLGLTAGYCGTLCTPMAANFNIVPAALLETKDKYSVIKAQIPTAAVMLAVHIVLMYLLAF